MNIELTKEQVIKMGALAVIASIPTGMGFMHYNPSLKVEDVEKTLKEYVDKYEALNIDYFQGRMVKFHTHKTPEGNWYFQDNITPDYQSWCRKYETYQELANAVKE